MALMTWTKPWILFEPILVFLESAQFSWISPFSASLTCLALSLVIGPLGSDKWSCANLAPFPCTWLACSAPWFASVCVVDPTGKQPLQTWLMNGYELAWEDGNDEGDSSREKGVFCGQSIVLNWWFYFLLCLLFCIYKDCRTLISVFESAAKNT